MSLFSWITKKHYPKLRESLRSSRPILSSLSVEERDIILDIHKKTNEYNHNNVTRTMAYYHFFIKYPEIEWALLAHFVSRNAGWNMTDLKGEWLSRLFSKEQANSYFTFMERANWLIFQDAYPQLLLFAHSKVKGEPLFHLLPHLNISWFMQVMWQDFWEDGNKQRINTALIINEQNYIQKRVIEKKKYGAPVISDIKFFLQDILDLNIILLPTLKENHVILYGEPVDSFPDLISRIILGKRLYTTLFNKDVLPGALHWCKITDHSGSRADYMPELFRADGGRQPGKYAIKLAELLRSTGVQQLYSPKLNEAWSDYIHEPTVTDDWYRDEEIVELLVPENHQIKVLNSEYLDLLFKIEKIVIGKELTM